MPPKSPNQTSRLRVFLYSEKEKQKRLKANIAQNSETRSSIINLKTEQKKMENQKYIIEKDSFLSIKTSDNKIVAIVHCDTTNRHKVFYVCEEAGIEDIEHIIKLVSEK